MPEHDPALQGWRALGAVDSASLRDARLQLHRAVQLIASVGYTHLPKAEDDGQSNTGWVDGMQILAGRHIGDPPTCFVSLAPASLSIALRDAGGEGIDEFALAGHTLDEAYEWLEQALATHLDREPQELVRPDYDLPEHPVTRGRPFQIESHTAFEELARWFHDANLVMRDLRAKESNATLPRVWPHHFDMGMLISLEEHGDPAQGRSIGIGLSPGDASDEAPYWYVNPYPRPETKALPAAPVGAQWNREGFFGLKMPAAVQVQGEGARQERRAREYLVAAVEACRGLLG